MPDADRPSEIQAPEAALALANLRALRAAAGYPMTGGLCTLLDEIARLERVIARLVAELDTLRADYADLEHSLGVPGEPVIA
jgi:hypothetical protein